LLRLAAFYSTTGFPAIFREKPRDWPLEWNALGVESRRVGRLPGPATPGSHGICRPADGGVESSFAASDFTPALPERIAPCESP
jgi:hypothetical protein